MSESNSKSIFYCTNSIWKSKSANFIQTHSMGKAFAHHIDDVHMVFRSSKDTKDDKVDYPYQQHIISAGESRFSRFLYSVRAIFLFVKVSKRNTFTYVYTRNMLFALLFKILFPWKSLAIELHTGIRHKSDKLIFYILTFLGVEIISITGSILDELNTHGIDTSCALLAHDGHSFDIQSADSVGPKEQQPLKVGYFGSLTPQKGLNLINEIIVSADPIKFRFHIFSKESSVLSDAEALDEIGFLNHNSVATKMLEMDVFLMTLCPQGEDDAISAYTSPLKMYEYLASGRPIIASEVNVLKEDTDDSMIFYAQNTSSSFIEVLNNIWVDREGARSKAIKGLEHARLRTWNSRARKIIHFLSKPTSS